MQADILSSIILPLSLFIIMMGLGLSLKVSDFTLIMSKPKAVVLGVSAQLLLLPLLAIIVVSLFDVPSYIAIGFFIIALCPSGTTSNLFTFLAKGDVALSVSLTAIVSLITPFTIPILLVLMMDMVIGEGQVINIPIAKTIIQLLAITVVPILLGMLIHNKAPSFAARADGPVRIFSVVFLIAIVFSIIIKNVEYLPIYFVQVGVPALLMNVCAILLGFFIAKIAKLNIQQSKTIGIEVGFQNGTTAILIALTILQNNEMSVAPTVYSLLMFATGAVFARLVSKTNDGKHL